MSQLGSTLCYAILPKNYLTGYAGGHGYNFNLFILDLNSQKACWICVMLANRIKLCYP